MAKRLTQALGVDIGTQSIKVAVVRLGRDGATVSALGKGATPENAVDHTGIYDPATLGAALRGVLAESGIGAKDVIFSITGQSAVVVRNLEVPRMSDKELSEHMQWEIQRNIPFAESTVVSDFRPVENPALDGTQNMEVVMAVSPQSAIDMVLDLLRAAGCKPAAIDVEPLGLGRVIRSCHPHDLGAKRVCLVNMGHSSTAINMYRSGVLSFPRTVPIGGSMLTQAISDSMGVTIDEAEHMKISQASIPDASSPAAGGFAVPGATMQADYQPYNPFGEEGAEGEPTAAPVPAAPGGDSRLFDAMSNQLAEFVAELRRSIDYYRSRGGDVDEVALTGGGAKMAGIDGYISRSLSLPVSRVNAFQGVAVEAPGYETYVTNGASEFAVAIGMGLHIAYD